MVDDRIMDDLRSMDRSLSYKQDLLEPKLLYMEDPERPII